MIYAQQARQFVRQIGYDPKDVASVEMFPGEILVSLFRRNEDGSLFLGTFGAAIREIRHSLHEEPKWIEGHTISREDVEKAIEAAYNGTGSVTDAIWALVKEKGCADGS